MGLDDAGLQRPPARSGGGRRALAGHVARAARGQPAVHRGLAHPPAPRRLLEAGLGLRGLRRDRVRRLRRRRLGRRVPQRDLPPARGPAGPAQGPDRPLVAQLPRGRHPRAGDRLPAGGAALVGPLAQGHRHRDHGRADAARLDAGAGAAARPTTPSVPGRWVAEPTWPAASGSSAKVVALDRARRPDASSAPQAARAPGAATGARTAARRSFRPTSASRTGSRLCFDIGAARRAARDPRASRRSTLTLSVRPPRRRSSACASATSHPTALPRSSPAACSTSPTATATSSRRRSARASATPSASRSSAIAHAFPPGHRLRVAVSPTYWPWAWPSPEPVTLTIHDGAARAARPPTPARRRRRSPPFDAPEAAEPLEVEIVRAKESGCEIQHDVVTGRLRARRSARTTAAAAACRTGSSSRPTARTCSRSSAGDPLSACTRSERTDGLSRGDWRVRVETSSVLPATRTASSSRTRSTPSRATCASSRRPGASHDPAGSHLRRTACPSSSWPTSRSFYEQHGDGPDLFWLAGGDQPGSDWHVWQTPAFPDFRNTTYDARGVGQTALTGLRRGPSRSTGRTPPR